MQKKTIELFTHKGELVVDPFNGSGTTLLAAHDLTRNAVGFDISKTYIPDPVTSNNAALIAHSKQNWGKSATLPEAPPPPPEATTPAKRTRKKKAAASGEDEPLFKIKVM